MSWICLKFVSNLSQNCLRLSQIVSYYIKKLLMSPNQYKCLEMSQKSWADIPQSNMRSKRQFESSFEDFFHLQFRLWRFEWIFWKMEHRKKVCVVGEKHELVFDRNCQRTAEIVDRPDFWLQLDSVLRFWISPNANDGIEVGR